MSWVCPRCGVRWAKPGRKRTKRKRAKWERDGSFLCDGYYRAHVAEVRGGRFAWSAWQVTGGMQNGGFTKSMKKGRKRAEQWIRQSKPS